MDGIEQARLRLRRSLRGASGPTRAVGTDRKEHDLFYGFEFGTRRDAIGRGLESGSPACHERNG